MLRKIFGIIFVGSFILAIVYQPIQSVQAQVLPSHWSIQDWKTSTPEEQGMDSEILAQMVEYIHTSIQDIHSILIIRNGSIVMEAYFFPYQSSYKHILNSATKSFTSALIGIAIYKGYIKDVNQYILDYFPDLTIAYNDSLKKKIQIKNLLTMTSGIDWPPTAQITNQMSASPDWVQFILDRPMATQPGSQFNYSNGDVHLLSAIITRTTQKSALEFGKENLFTPLGISDFYWPSDPRGNTIGCASLYLKPTDMAKLGYLYLRQGIWNNDTIVSSNWISASLEKHSSYSGLDYGYLWWLNPSLGVKQAWGSGGERISIFPNLNIVVVITGGVLNNPNDPLFAALCQNYIQAAVKSSASLPANSTGMAQLESWIQKVAQAPDAGQVPPLPNIALAITNKIFTFDPNPLNLQSALFHFQNSSSEAALTLNVGGISNPWTIGLDNVYRINPIDTLSYGAIKGFWQNDSTFVIDNSIPVNALKYQYTIHFSQNRVKVLIQEPLTETSVNITGSFIPTSIEQKSLGKIASFVLEQNFPNPFNPTTNISFSIQSRSFVLLKVFDLLGRDVATLVSEKLNSGSYTRQWNAAGLPTGVYFYRISTDSFTETKKLVLVR